MNPAPIQPAGLTGSTQTVLSSPPTIAIAAPLPVPAPLAPRHVPESEPPVPALTSAEFQASPATPRWIRDIFRFLPVKSQFITAGNVRDRYPFPVQGRQFVPLFFTSYLASALQLRGYEYFISYDPIDGFTVVSPRGSNDAANRRFFQEQFRLSFDARDRMRCTLERSLELIADMVAHRENFIAVFLDFASRYAIRPNELTEKEHDYFSRALKLSHVALPHATATMREAQFNSIFWICDRENDLPGWFALDNPRIRSLVIPKPDHLLRRAMIEGIAPSLPGFVESTESENSRQTTVFVEQTEAMLISDLIAITQLSRREQLPFSEIGEAVRRFKLGVSEDPWRRIDRQRIVEGRDFIEKRLKGQTQAVVKALDIIKRAVTGLSGAQAARVGGRPRGVMFLAGPTGVGKTELAKALTELLFGDERAYIRFDMSEFSQPHSDQRLIGSPPGYVGYDAGGELTNAIREKPFSVVLFDEIEKAHPRILDKFLQMLDDGVMTSGRGERVYFSEAVIVFTSNLGIFKASPDGERVPNVLPSDPYDLVEKKVRLEIDAFFKTQLNRPEILNRIGENIVVFDFIRLEVGARIFEKMVMNVLQRLEERQRVRVRISEDAAAVLGALCLADLSNGGRGIGNQIEAWLVNPLARRLFDIDVAEGTPLLIREVITTGEVPELDIVVDPEGQASEFDASTAPSDTRTPQA